ncbi:MAG: hypothetical protein K6T51_12005 [Rubrobacteraceae bacterium]|uniref:hypothetical protein n=1 Tax=Rubrobacter naiadicus TaxID=1392641 RepID=UPI00236147AA|nr:hypothetical protein [Rubrobacter naiadicus]MBX6762763.1 succinate dehydrogenase [Rubrobacteraceae bacterium]MCL6439325.1 hypothetical protein [Rubrobacteraceae bacterium]
MSSIAAAWKKLPWWVEPMTVVIVLAGFGIYSFIVVVFAQHSSYHDLLSPFYSPHVNSPVSWLSPAMLVAWIPLGFRITCYYYRKAYYRAFFWDPPACVARAQNLEPRHSYNGERGFFVWNNIHRYFLYASSIVVLFLWYDAIRAFFPGGSFGFSIGSLILLINVILLSMYTGSCHSFRHLIGGGKDCYTCIRGGMARRKAYGWVSRLNTRHSLWAWLSLFSVLIADIYIRLLIAGVITDIRIV